MITESDLARFWSRVDIREPSDCWPWVGNSRLAKGYGLFCFQGQNRLAHRFALASTGVEVPREKNVLHSCDNPSCVNPAHLRLGTQKENMDDRSARTSWKHTKPRTEWKERTLANQPRGERVNTAVISADTAREVWRLRLTTDLSHPQIAEQAGAPLSAVRGLLQGRTWRHLPEAPSPELLRARNPANVKV